MPNKSTVSLYSCSPLLHRLHSPLHLCWAAVQEVPGVFFYLHTTTGGSTKSHCHTCPCPLLPWHWPKLLIHPETSTAEIKQRSLEVRCKGREEECQQWNFSYFWCWLDIMTFVYTGQVLMSAFFSLFGSVITLRTNIWDTLWDLM